MMYGYMTLDDGTEIVHSEMKEDGSVKVYIEKPIMDGFKNATCYLPDYRWCDIDGFDKNEMDVLDDIVKNNAHLILEFASRGGFEKYSSNDRS